MASIKVSIIRIFDDEYYPAYAECILKDVLGVTHRFIDKLPIFTELDLDSKSIVPQDGIIRCEIIRKWEEKGESLIKASTDKPDAVETSEGITTFILLESQVIQDEKGKLNGETD